MNTRDLLRRLRRMERQLEPEVASSASSAALIPPEITDLIGRVTAAWCRRIIRGLPPALEHASAVDLVVAAASYFDFEQAPVALTGALSEMLARAFPNAADPRRAELAGLAERLHQLLRGGYLHARAEGLSDFEIAIQEGTATDNG